MTASDVFVAVAFTWLALVALAAMGAAIVMRRELRAVREELRAAQLGSMQLMAERAEQVQALYERVLERKKDDTASIVESAVRLATTGSAAPPTALVQSPEPDGEQILRSRVVEETIQNGMSKLREEYRLAGMAVPSDEVLREEAELMLYGILPESGTAGAIRP